MNIGNLAQNTNFFRGWLRGRRRRSELDRNIIRVNSNVSDLHVPILRRLSSALCVGWVDGLRLWLEPCFGSFTELAELVSRDGVNRDLPSSVLQRAHARNQ